MVLMVHVAVQRRKKAKSQHNIADLWGESASYRIQDNCPEKVVLKVQDGWDTERNGTTSFLRGFCLFFCRRSYARGGVFCLGADYSMLKEQKLGREREREREKLNGANATTVDRRTQSGYCFSESKKK